MRLGARNEFWLLHLGWVTWASHLASVGLSFLIGQVEILRAVVRVN